jgi:hypothetical protein
MSQERSWRHQNRSEPRPPLAVQEVDESTVPFGERSDAICTLAWVADGFEAVQIFVNPALMDRAEALCEEAQVWTTAHRTLESLNRAIQDYARDERLSASVYEGQSDDLSEGVVAVTFEVG